MIVGALAAADVHAMRDRALAPAFLEGRRDIRFTDLDMDSLAVMELCIAIEVNSGVSLVPEDLLKMATLYQLVARVRRDLA